jgi:hypothetical protein
MTRTIHRHEIPVDDSWHPRAIQGPPVHVAARHPDTVEFWCEVRDGYLNREVEFSVFGTGHVIPDGAEYQGTALADHGLVWHLYMSARDQR